MFIYKYNPYFCFMFGIRIISLWLSLFCWGFHQLVPHEHDEGYVDVCQITDSETLDLKDVFAHFHHVQSLDHFQDESSDVAWPPCDAEVMTMVQKEVNCKHIDVGGSSPVSISLRLAEFIQEHQSLPPPTSA